MKVKVYYTVVKEKFVEVDDKYKKIIDDDWYNENYYEARDLMRDLDDDVIEQIENVGEIIAVWSEDDQTVFYEN